MAGTAVEVGLSGKTLGILGLGLMGGSLARAVKQEAAGVRILGWNRSPASRQQADEAGVFDAICADVGDLLRASDLIVLCVPVLVAVDLMAKHAVELAGRGVVVTDVGSTKADVCGELGPVLSSVGCEFVGSHPICGGEQSGFSASDADLYRDAVVVVTPAAHASGLAVRQVEALWSLVGARVLKMAPDLHDRVLARTSHLPHVAAAALVHTVVREASCPVGLSGSGFVDSTRVASGPEGVWHDIIKSNARAVSGEVRALAEELLRVADLVDAGAFTQLQEWFGVARRARADVLAARAKLADGLE